MNIIRLSSGNLRLLKNVEIGLSGNLLASDKLSKLIGLALDVVIVGRWGQDMWMMEVRAILAHRLPKMALR